MGKPAGILLDPLGAATGGKIAPGALGLPDLAADLRNPLEGPEAPKFDKDPGAGGAIDPDRGEQLAEARRAQAAAKARKNRSAFKISIGTPVEENEQSRKGLSIG